MKLKIAQTISAVAASSLIVGSASAASLTFDGGTGDWDQTTSNWNSGSAAFVDGDDVTFNGTAGTVSVTTDVSPASTSYTSNNNSTFLSTGGVITGSGGLVKDGSGTLIFGNTGSSMANTFSGGTVINSGQLRINRGDLSNPLGTGDVTLNGGTLFLWRVNMANNLIINGGNVISSNGFGNVWAGGITLNSDLDLFAQFNININGVIDGTEGINLTGGTNRNLFLNGVNTYTGDTSVSSGRLVINGTSLNDSGALIVSGSGLVIANNTEVVGSLTLGGVEQTDGGTYGAIGSGADFESAFFDASGSGFVELAIPEPSSTALLALGGLALIARRRK